MALTSVLEATKKNLGIEPEIKDFDYEIESGINGAFSNLRQLGYESLASILVEDDTVVWDALGIPSDQLSAVKQYVYLKTRVVFDPPQNSFLETSLENQIKELEFRINVAAEGAFNG